jgi:hypothetical protein
MHRFYYSNDVIMSRRNCKRRSDCSRDLKWLALFRRLLDGQTQSSPMHYYLRTFCKEYDIPS